MNGAGYRSQRDYRRVLIAGEDPDPSNVFHVFSMWGNAAGLSLRDFQPERWDSSTSLKSIQKPFKQLDQDTLLMLAIETWGWHVLDNVQFGIWRIDPIASFILVITEPAKTSAEAKEGFSSGYWAPLFPRRTDFKIDLDQLKVSDRQTREAFLKALDAFMLRYQTAYSATRRVSGEVHFSALMSSGDEVDSFIHDFKVLLRSFGKQSDDLAGWEQCAHGRYFTWQWGSLTINGKAYRTACADCVSVSD